MKKMDEVLKLVNKLYRRGVWSQAALTELLLADGVTIGTNSLRKMLRQIDKDILRRTKGAHTHVHGLWGHGSSVKVCGELEFVCRIGLHNTLYRVGVVKFSTADIDHIEKTEEDGLLVVLAEREICKGVKCKNITRMFDEAKKKGKELRKRTKKVNEHAFCGTI